MAKREETCIQVVLLMLQTRSGPEQAEENRRGQPTGKGYSMGPLDRVVNHRQSMTDEGRALIFAGLIAPLWGAAAPATSRLHRRIYDHVPVLQNSMPLWDASSVYQRLCAPRSWHLRMRPKSLTTDPEDTRYPVAHERVHHAYFVNIPSSAMISQNVQQ